MLVIKRISPNVLQTLTAMNVPIGRYNAGGKVVFVVDDSYAETLSKIGVKFSKLGDEANEKNSRVRSKKKRNK